MTTYILRPRPRPGLSYRPLVFEVADTGGYVRLDGRQICHGGGWTGSTLMAERRTLPTVARRWWRQHKAGLNDFEWYGAQDA